ncbi:MAG: T9SS type A sorting domain-containing protein [Candidatus Cloacimonetes bacterium]|nr:T9SS type A sorting domain-containing protein [Candidatus Cloacimonadota bacterium]
MEICLLPFLISATTWYVDGTVGTTGNGSPGSPFKTIAEAVTALSDGDEVEVAEATYEETVDFDDHYFDLVGVGEVVIAGGEANQGIKIPSGNPAITGLSTIVGFIIKDCYANYGGGISIINRNVNIADCIIEDNSSDSDGGGIYFSGDDGYILFIENSDIHDNVSEGSGGGIYFSGTGSDELLLKDSQIYNNICEGFGGGIFVSGADGYLSPVNFDELSIYGNTAVNGEEDGAGGGIYGTFLTQPQNYKFDNLLIYENSADVHGGGINLFNLNTGFLLNCLTVVNNQSDSQECAGIYINEVNITVSNSIVYGNECLQYNPVQIPGGNTVRYCDVEGGYTTGPGTIGNIDADPDFIDSASDDYRLEDYSICIDMGDTDSDFNDPDNSRADMGYEYVDQDEFIFTGEGGPSTPVWKWLSYPRLPFGVDNDNEGGYVSSGYVRHHWNTMPTECGWYNISGAFLLGTYVDDEWDWDYIGNPPEFSSITGYKVYRKGTSSNHYSPGNKCEDDTQIAIGAGENWIGYFLEDSQLPSDALPSAVLDDLNSVQTQSWSWVKDGHGNWPEDIYTINYGDLVIVDAEGGGYSFAWETPRRIDPVIRPVPEHYSFIEEMDYIPIYIDFGENDLPFEVAVFIEDVCKGAVVTDGQVTQLCAYLLECDPGLLVEFEFYYDNRQYDEKVRNYDIETAFCSEKNSSLKTGMAGDVYYVSFRNMEFEVPEPPFALHCFPNPFNPELTISFSLNYESEVELVIYNIKGQKIKTMVNELFRPADYTLIWNGTDDSNRSVSSGVYFIRLQVGDELVSDKVILMK